MQNALLTALLGTLEKKEQRDFRKFLASPFFNLRQDVALLFELLIKCLNEGHALPDKQPIFHLLYGADQPFDDHRVRMAMSMLLKLVEQFLVVNELLADEVKAKAKLAEVYRKRNLPKHFERAVREATELNEKNPYRNDGFFSDSFALQLEQFRFASVGNRSAAHNLQAITDDLDIAYFARKLRQACLMLSHQAVYKTAYRFGMLDPLLHQVAHEPVLQVPAVMVYYYCYLALTRPDQPEHFHQLKKLLVEECAKFPPQEIADLYLLAINFCIKRYNEGDRQHLADEFDLYKQGFKHAYLLQNGVLSRFTFRNAITLGLVMGDFDWVERFIHEFKGKLEPRHRESMLSFNLARLAYARQHYAQALQLLQKSEYDDLLLNLAAKTVMLKVYFETHEHDALESHLSAMQRFIHRKKIMGYHRENYLNTIHFTRKLMEAVDKTAMEALGEEIAATKSVAEREWLLRLAAGSQGGR